MESFSSMPKSSPRVHMLSKALASINADPIKQLINTHWHFDHTGGNAWLHEAGASILAQENTRKHLLVDTHVEDWYHTFPAAPPGAIPSTVFTEDHTLHVNGSTLDSQTLLARSHRFRYLRALCGSRYFSRWRYISGIAIIPFIDYSTGGSIDGTIRAAEANIASVTDKMIVIPGHGAVGGKADLILFRDVLAGIREKVAAFKKQGRSLQDAIAAKPGAATDEEWGNGFRSPAKFVSVVYQGV